VTAILGIAAVVPRPGRSFVSSMPFATRLVLGAVLKAAGTKPPDKAVRALAHGLPGHVTDQIVTDFEPEAIRLYRDPTPARDLPAARAYVRGTADNEISPAVQRASARTLQASWIEEMPTGHLPMLQEPARVSRSVRRLLATINTTTPVR
jgi:pimeloyl-ACP methyl ester carboxylesterase